MLEYQLHRYGGLYKIPEELGYISEQRFNMIQEYVLRYLYEVAGMKPSRKGTKKEAIYNENLKNFKKDIYIDLTDADIYLFIRIVDIDSPGSWNALDRDILDRVFKKYIKK